MAASFRFIRVFMVLAAIIEAAHAPSTCQGADSSDLFIATRIKARQVRSVTRTWLKLPAGLVKVEAAWAGLVEDDIDHDVEFIVRSRFQAERHTALANADAVEECQALKRHLKYERPTVFDAVIFSVDSKSTKSLVLVIDRDVDGDLSDESIQRLRWNSLPSMADYLTVSAGVVAAASPLEAKTKSDSAAQAMGGTNETIGESAVEPLDRLMQLDQMAAVRKQHLPEIVALIDTLLADSTGDQRADLLYRKGRALGYMELPDVVAKFPVKDPELLQQKFEATYHQLTQLVDIRKSQYVLLGVRRERRLGRRGLALDLVQHYRATHPNPVWYHKKRADLTQEIGVRLVAHQAAIALWRLGKMPPRPNPREF